MGHFELDLFRLANPHLYPEKENSLFNVQSSWTFDGETSANYSKPDKLRRDLDKALWAVVGWETLETRKIIHCALYKLVQSPGEIIDYSWKWGSGKKEICCTSLSKVVWNNQMWSYEGIKGEIRDMISFKIDLFVKNFSTWFMTCCHSFCGSSKRLQEELGRRKKSGVPHLKTGFCAFSKKKGERIHGLHFWPWFAFRDPDGPAYHPTYKWHHLSKHHILDHFEL